MSEMIYLDHAATTAVSREAASAMFPYLHDRYGNPSSAYDFAAENKKVVETAREEIAATLGCKGSSIYFTSGGTESDNWALRGIAEGYKEKGRHIITSKIEHHAILHTCHYLEEQGYDVTYLDVEENGILNTERLKKAIRPDTILISVMFANNEIGTIQPVKEIGQIARKYGILFHTDAVQAYGQIPILVDEYSIDLLSVSGHKIYGPKGIGFLYVREGLAIKPLLFGGGQENHMRAGTENVAGIVGLAKAAVQMQEGMMERNKRIFKMREHLVDRVLKEIPYVRLNGSRTGRLSGNANFCFQFLEGESLLIMLDMNHIAASAGSACTTGQKEASHVLAALGLPDEVARGALRLSLGSDNTMEEIDFVVDTMKQIVDKLREGSREYAGMIKTPD